MIETVLDPETESAIDLLNRVGARQWRDKNNQWIISIPNQHARLRVAQAVEKIEKNVGAQACVLWVARRE